MGVALAKFPGIEKVISFSMTLSQGITPSVCVVTITPQDNFVAADGTLTITDGQTSITFKDAHIDSMSYSRDGGGRVWRLAILDRRWKWAMARKGPISGVYNTLQPSDGKIDVKTEKTPKELAELLFKAMDEPDGDFSELPNETRPEINWDYAIPAEALAALCDQFGCRVCLQLDNKVKIRKLGQGGSLPESGGTPIVDDSGTVDPPERPDMLRLLGAFNRYQCRLKLEPRALESDGRIVKLEEASYMPAGGWVNCSLDADEWEDISDDVDTQRCAAASVFRFYAVTGNHDGTLDFPDLLPKRLERIDQIFPLDSSLVEQKKDPFDERMKDLPAKVVGHYLRFGLDPGNTDEDDEILVEYDGGFTIDGDRGLVIFNSPVVYEGDNGYEAAPIFLETSFGYRDPETRALIRYERDLRATGEPNGSGARIYRDEGFVAAKYVTYDSHGHVNGVTDNKEELEPRAKKFLEEAGTEYQIRRPRDMRYAGIHKIELDGAIQQVAWEGGPSGAFTRASRNNEFANYLPGYKERRRLEDNRGEAAMRQRLAHLFRDRGPRDAPA